MELKIINKEFAVCKLKGLENIKFTDEYYFIGKTDEEISLVCEESSIPVDCIDYEKGWRAFKIQGILDFSLVGILLGISVILAKNDISIFAISTFNTDYILVNEENYIQAIDVLRKNEYDIT